MNIYTVGHSTHEIEYFIKLLQLHRIQILVDIRSYPGSRRCPQFGQVALANSVRAAGLRYIHIPQLGGRRHGTIENSGNEGWRVASFRSYADYALGAQFAAGLTSLEVLARCQCVAYMCAESTHFKCHRRIVSDHLRARGWTVQHILPSGNLQEHEYTEHLQLVHGSVRYPVSPC